MHAYIIALQLLVGDGFAVDKQWSFSALNLTPCEGIGIHGSYGLTVRATVEEDGPRTRFTFLQVEVNSSQSDLIVSGTITLRDAADTTERIELETPWYATLSPAESGPTLVLPRARTDSAGPSPREMRSIEFDDQSTVELTISPAISGCALGSVTRSLSLTAATP